MEQDAGIDRQDESPQRRRTLWIVLLLNLGLAIAFGLTGLAADSSALIANGLDNASDTFVYAISLFALNRSAIWKVRAARVSGALLLLFAAGVLIDVGRRFLEGSEPIGVAMMGMAFVAAVVNATCLWLLKRLDQSDVNLRAATTFSFNDFISNGGILVAGVLVALVGSNWPDLVVGLATAAIAFKGGMEIMRDASGEGDGGSKAPR
jgi:Co/Zn/Cd efflux system component